MARSAVTKARRTLIALTVITVVLIGTLAAGVRFSDADWTPKLALDLAGGTQMVLTPIVEPGQGEITTEVINEAIAIMRQRVDATGVSEAEISSQGGTNIVVELPGSAEEQAQQRELVRQSAQMRFRPVLVQAAPGPAPAPEATEPGGEPTGEPTDAPADPEATLEPPADPEPTTTTDGRAIPQHLRAATTAPDAATDPSPPAETEPAADAETDAPEEPEGAEATPAAEPTSPSDLAWITPDIQAQFEALDCTNEENLTGGIEDDVTKPLVTCAQDGSSKFILGPVEVEGAQIDSATAGLGTNQQGIPTNEWIVQLEFDSEGAEQFRETTTRLWGLSPPQNQFAIVLDGLVVSAPRIENGPIPNGQAQISGSFTQESAQELANQLKFGALPMSFEVQTEAQISALLGEEQLQRGLFAGLVGMLAVFIYMLVQYRALGLVTIGSLVVAGLLTYVVITLLSWYQGYRLSLAGVAGVIIGIATTADSFIVYFERIKDEVREGRSLVAAVEEGWRRARRTIIISDSVSLLAALILYFLTVGSVRGFAFTLGLTTLLDLVIVVFFTHPLLVILARTKFFGSGSRWSGFDAEHLKRTAVYAGRGRIRTKDEVSGASSLPTPTGMTLAERKAAARREEADESVTADRARES